MLTRRGFLIGAGCLSAVAARAEIPASARKLIEAARSQIGRTLYYDPAYVKLAYPKGDVPVERGVCTDVVIRAYRGGLGLDLQKLVHEDMRRHFAAYPRNWGLKAPDTNIDHRRVPNLQTYFKHQGAALKVSEAWPGFEPGDIITVKLPGNLDHIGIVSDTVEAKTKLPNVIHNIGQGAREDATVFQFTLTGRYRYAL